MTGWTALSVPLSFAASVFTDPLLGSIRRTTDLLASHSSPTHQQPKGPRVSCVPLAFAECAPPPVAFEVRSSKAKSNLLLHRKKIQRMHSRGCIIISILISLFPSDFLSLSHLSTYLSLFFSIFFPFIGNQLALRV
ncbi:hypothetical protein BJ912DRAFT_99837 [Pholiota molesta]|nr:hypothetical protein BJ912DRAFT_99837 [Pholiota molesta]